MKKLISQFGNLKLKLTLGKHFQIVQITFSDGTVKEIESPIGYLINNHLISIQSIIEQSSYHLHLAHKEVSQNIANELFKRKEDVLNDINLIEWNQEKSLNAAIIFNNILFDYIKILITLVYSDLDTLYRIAPKEDVVNDMKRDTVNDADWYLSLFSILGTRSVFDKWFKATKGKLNAEVVKCYSNLKWAHKDFQRRYQPNALKHFGATAFKRTDPANILRSDFCNISLNTFYNNPTNKSFGIGGKGNMLEFDKTRNEIISDFKNKMEFIQLLISQIK